MHSPRCGSLTERPYEPMGLTTTLWLQIRPSRVFTDSLVQRQPLDESLLDGPDTSLCGDPIPHAVLWNGQLEVSDGNHRIARAKRREQETMLVRVAVPFVHFLPYGVLS